MSHPVWARHVWSRLPVREGCSSVLFPATLPVLRCEAYFTVIVSTNFAAYFCWLVCKRQRVNGPRTAERAMPRTFALDAITVCDFVLRINLVPTVRSDVWVLQLVVVIPEDVFEGK
jgi:hypothetical protein